MTRAVAVLAACVLLSGCLSVDGVGVKVTFKEPAGSAVDLASPTPTHCIRPPGYFADGREC